MYVYEMCVCVCVSLIFLCFVAVSVCNRLSSYIGVCACEQMLLNIHTYGTDSNMKDDLVISFLNTP